MKVSEGMHRTCHSSATHVDERIDCFLQSFVENLKKMPDSDFQHHVRIYRKFGASAIVQVWWCQHVRLKDWSISSCMKN